LNPKRLIFLILLCPVLYIYSQGYLLEVGERYRLYQSFNQNTMTESSNVRGNVSLDILSTVIIEVTGINDTLGYEIDCRYEDLELSLFSSDMNIAISSETRGISMIMKYIEMLEEHTFNGVLSYTGELISISNLDDHILLFYNEKEERSNEQDIIIKTLKEAFGEDAFTGFINLSLNVYCENQESKCLKNVYYSFNAKPIILHNTFYMQPPTDEHIRIQGIGAIEAKEEEIEFQGGTITSNMNGSQTFDHLFDAKTGWLIEGNSRQKIYVTSVFRGNNDLPDGLEVPSITETDFEFYGEKIEDDN
jgi:hypothetical protein